MKTSILLIALSPLTWLVILLVIVLLFGAGRLPKLARALGQSKRALKEGLSEKPERQE